MAALCCHQSEAPQGGTESEFLELRKRLKEKFRAKMEKTEKTDGSALHSDDHGSFFGPSEPAIAQRVIQDSKSWFNREELAVAKASKLTDGKKKSGGIALVEFAALQAKIKMIRASRDYSFLSSDNVKPEAPEKLKSNGSVPSILANSSPLRLNNKQEASSSSNKVLHKKADALKFSEKKIDGQSPKPKGLVGKVPKTATPNLLTGSKKQIVGQCPEPNGLVSKKPTAAAFPVVRKPPQSNSVPKKTQEYGIQKLLPKKPAAKQLPLAKKRRRQVVDSDDEEDNEVGVGGGIREGSRAIVMIRKMMGYDPRRYRDVGDDRNMEASFSEIQKEERRSAKAGAKEDDEEEKKEKLMQLKARMKKQKL